jgi:hypothetical protein
MATRLFRGKSKQLYDYLWSQSRGAVVPSRTVRRSRPQLLRGAGFGSMGTVERCVDFLVEVGLLKVRSIVGEAEGNEYEVFTPEEVGPALFGLHPSTGTTHETGSTGSTLNQVLPVVPETGSTGSTLSSTESEVSGGPKTSFKTDTKTDDDEAALSDLISIFAEANQKLTGRLPRATERAQWAELASILVEELNAAAARTFVSSVPAFLAAHLRRKLAPKPATRKKEGNLTKDPGRPSAPPPDPNHRLTPEEIAERARDIAETIEGGYTLEQAEAQFGGGYHPEDWALIRSTALAQVGPNKGK